MHSMGNRTPMEPDGQYLLPFEWTEQRPHPESGWLTARSRTVAHLATYFGLRAPDVPVTRLSRSALTKESAAEENVPLAANPVRARTLVIA